MICSLAIATNTLPSQWLQEDDQMIMTAIDILEKQAEEANRKR